MVTHAVIVAAGSGRRFGSDIPKQFLPLGQSHLPVLMHTVDAFIRSGIMHKNLRIVLSPDMMPYWSELCAEYNFETPPVVKGGATRFHSVKNALESIDAAPDDVILVHDGARPLVTPELIGRVIQQTQSSKSAVPTTPVTDSLRKKIEDSPEPAHTVPVDRSRYVAVQTPQGFAADLLKEAYRQPYNDMFTDDASVVDALGSTVIATVDGEIDNIKITTPRDLIIADALMGTKH